MFAKLFLVPNQCSMAQRWKNLKYALFSCLGYRNNWPAIEPDLPVWEALAPPTVQLIACVWESFLIRSKSQHSKELACPCIQWLKTMLQLWVRVDKKVLLYVLVLLRSKIPSGMCAKLRTVAASNNRDHPTRSLYYCFFAPHTYIFVLHAHPVRGESYNQRNTTGEVATVSRR